MGAAIGAAVAGANVTLLERSTKLGGTTAVSGGIAWFPANKYMANIGASDTVEDALLYLKDLCVGDVNWSVVQACVEDAARVAELIDDNSPVDWVALPIADYYGENAGAHPGGRSLMAEPLSVDSDFARLIQDQFENTLGAARFGMVTGTDADDGDEEEDEEFLFLGRAIIGGLVQGCRQLGVDIRTGVRAKRLVFDGDEVCGVEDENGVVYPGRVIVATGGFQFDETLSRAFLRGPMLAPAGVPTHDGDGLRMFLQAGAQLANMGEGHWNTSMMVPGEEFEGAPYYRMVIYERAAPHSIMVNAQGKRFVNEAQNYGDVGRTLQNFFAPDYAFANTPAWLVFDQTFRERYAVGPVRPGEPDPEWLISEGDLASLAERIAVPAAAFTESVKRFNEGARAGVDPDFHRGEFLYDRTSGDANAEFPNLGAIETAPFFAIPLVPGCASTKGGPVTDAWGRVQKLDGGTIKGLYAAGVAAASPFGIACWASGNSVGPGLIIGCRAGEAATRD
jgi:succinate dehydrogenase/fumarate reductase flavoprotein subunit